MALPTHRQRVQQHPNQPEDAPSFGAWLRQQRRALDLTQAELAAQVGCARITIRRIEADELKPSLQLAELFVEHLGVPPEQRKRWLQFARGLAPMPQPQVTDLPAPTPATPPRPPTNLLAPLTTFLGRDHEIIDGCHLVTTSRLLTLTGVGGAGKTRLALEIARTLVNQWQPADTNSSFPDGIWWVELAPLTDASLIPETVAKVLGLREQPGQSIERLLMEMLQTKQMLLLLDNCEHLVAACAQWVQQWLHHAPHLHILATSREPLHLLGEQRFPVAPLAAAVASELFVQRARLVDPAFTRTAANSAAIDQLCQQVDYLPLAIELLAARSDLFSPQAMLERLQKRPLDLLSAEMRNLPVRQRTLRHTIQHSYDLLTEREQTLFRTLSVYAGGFDLSAISYMGFDEEALYTLVNRSMVQSEAEHNGVHRFRLLETLRTYGSELLTANQEESAVRKLHATYYIQLVETVEPALRGPRMKTHLAQLETEYNNVRAALAWAQEGDENTTALRSCGALWRFWLIHGRLREGKFWIDKFISDTSAVPICIRAKALIAAGNIELIIGQNAHAQALFKQSLELYHESGDKLGIASALMELANALRYDNDYKRIPILCTQSLRLCQEIEDMWGIAVVYTLLGYTAMNEQGDYQTARVYFTCGLTLQRQVGDYIWIIHALHGLAFAAIQLSEYQTAVTHYEEVLALSRELNDMHSVAVALNDLGSIMLHQQNYVQATSYFAESFALAQKLCYPSLMQLTLNNQGNMAFQRGDFALAKQCYNQSLLMAHQIGDRLGIAGQLESLAHIAQAYGQAQKTVKLLSMTECLRRRIGVPLPASHRSRQQTLIAIVLSQLGQVAFDSVWTEGQGLTLNAAIALALEDSQ